MDFVKRWCAWALLAVMAAGLACGCAREHVFPDRPVVLICPWSAGGGTDRVSRFVAAQLEAKLGVPVNVVNATGGAGVTGHTRGMLARPNGYTLTMMTAELSMLHWRGLTNITYQDFQPLMLVNRDDAAVFVRTDAAWDSLEALEEAIRKAPGTLKASGTAQGGIWHVALAGWLSAVGMGPGDVTWISINGATPSLQELMAGGLDIVCCSLPEGQALLDAGEVRCLGLMSEHRLPAFPDVPTFAELGTDWALGTWRGLGLPKGVPQDRVDRLAEALEGVVTSEAYLDFMAQAGFNPAAEPPAQFEQTLARLDEQLGAILTSDAFRSVRTLRIGPMAFPALLGVLLAVNLAALAFVRRRGKASEAAVGTEPVTAQGLGRIGLILGGVVAYILLAEWLGFIVTASAVLFVLLWRLGNRWYVSAALAAVLVLAVYEVFAVYLRVPLPLGWWGG